MTQPGRPTMDDFKYVKYGILLAFLSILLGGFLGLSFGCCEDAIKDQLNASSNAVLAEKYQNKPELAKKVTDKAWVYFKRAHLHSQTMGIMAIVFSLLLAKLKFNPKFQLWISLLSGLGALGYGVFWLLAALLAPGMGSTGAAKEAVGIIAQLSGGSFFVSGVGLATLLTYRFFILKPTKAETSRTD